MPKGRRVGITFKTAMNKGTHYSSKVKDHCRNSENQDAGLVQLNQQLALIQFIQQLQLSNRFSCNFNFSKPSHWLIFFMYLSICVDAASGKTQAPRHQKRSINMLSLNETKVAV